MRDSQGTSRRRFLAGAAGLVGGGIVAVTARDLVVGPASAAAPQPRIRPRNDWGDGLAPKGTLDVERPEDVKFLLVHHTAGANGYAQTDVRQTLRGIFSYHTGAKGWKDVAYNFFVDAFGGIWEGRAGSLKAPVKGDATGGSQGFAQLCCFIGDHQKTPPTAAAQTAMADLLAWLAGVYAIDLTPGKKTSFVSRGSNLHPAGKSVTTSTIAAHRDMSKTACPGDACYTLVRGSLAAAAAAKAGGAAAPARVSPTLPVADPSPTSVPSPATSESAASSLPAASPTQIEEDNPPPSITLPAARPAPVAADGDALSTGRLVGLGGVGAAAAVAGAGVLRRRRARAASESRWYRSELLNPPSEPPPPPLGSESSAADGPVGESARRRPHLYRPEE